MKIPAQSINLADEYPDKVKELEDLFWKEAEKYDAFPIGGSLGQNAAARIESPGCCQKALGTDPQCLQGS